MKLINAEYIYRRSRHELMIFFSDECEITEARDGEWRFALVVEPPVIILLFQFGQQGWNSAPYCWHLVPEPQRSIPLISARTEIRAEMEVFVIDPAGAMQPLRTVRLSASFTRELHRAIVTQSLREWDRSEYDSRLAEIYQHRQTGESLVRLAGILCWGEKEMTRAEKNRIAGRKGGQARSYLKMLAARENAQKGGRPKKKE